MSIKGIVKYYGRGKNIPHTFGYAAYPIYSIEVSTTIRSPLDGSVRGSQCAIGAVKGRHVSKIDNLTILRECWNQANA
jgi:hypothetical protein